MHMCFEKAAWIWPDTDAKPDEYAAFETTFSYDGGEAVLHIAAETDYIAYVNGKKVGFGQFAGYPFQKYYDTLPISMACQKGENTLSVTVRYEGLNSATHIDDGAGVIFTLEEDGAVTAYSSVATKAGLDGRYIQHVSRLITEQLGSSSGMQAPRPHLWMDCRTVKKSKNILPRPVAKTKPQAVVQAKPLPQNPRIFDLGREEAGYITLRVTAKKDCLVKVAFAEHINSGEVCYLFPQREFALDFACTAGENIFEQCFVRVAARYLQVICEEELTDLSLKMTPYLYPVTEKEISLSAEDQRIYDACVRTLRLCMNTHYEDCPWREQALYVLDSRNQMLCGYYAFQETEFPRANLVLISKGLRKEGLLELTYPAVDTPAIPFFSVMYSVAVYEYVQHTGDESILPEVMPTMLTIMNTLKARLSKDALIESFPAPFWNFYEWNDGLNGIKGNAYYNPPDRYDLVLNAAFVYAAEKLQDLCKKTKERFDCDLSAMRQAIVDTFFHAESGLFHTDTHQPNHFSQLGNAFALLIGLGDNRTAEAIKAGNLVPATLSMLGYVYDALLAADEGNADYVLTDIRNNYNGMLDAGSTTVWETLDALGDFGAGSLCHGWSAMPVYYYHRLNHNETRSFD